MAHIAHSDKVAALGEELPRSIVELEVEDLVTFGGQDVPTISRQDDWTLSSQDRLPAHVRQMREYLSTLTSQGMVNWATITPSGFGPKEPQPFSGRDKVFPARNGDEVIISVPMADLTELRSEAGLIDPSTGHGGRVSSAHMYSDWLSSARFTSPCDDDAFDDDGLLAWERLDEFDSVEPAIDPWWE